MEYFVSKQSIVRQIWGKSDTILFIFAGAAAEFALNKAVDWLYFTGRLPADPLGRLFSTVRYARDIVFSENEAANKTIDNITAIHKSVEKKRSSVIPDWAYRDVLFILIHYSIASFEVLERKLTGKEKEEVFAVFFRVGKRMGLIGLPDTYRDWLPVRVQHLEQDLKNSHFTVDLLKQYKKHLGVMRYKILIQAQRMVVPQKVKELLQLRGKAFFLPVMPLYKLSRQLKIDWLLKLILIPAAYQSQIKNLDYEPGIA